MIASLPMYDFPELRDATDGLWQAIAAQLGVDVALNRDLPYADVWHCDDLLLSQACGYPLTHAYRGQLTYVATPHYTADGCDGPRYCSIVLAREAKPLIAFCDSVAAVNAVDSMSGMLALKLVLNTRDIAGEMVTGSHAASMRAVQEGRADICAIDCVTLALLQRHRPSVMNGLVEVARSPLVPGLPLVTRTGDVDELKRVLLDTFADPAHHNIFSALMISGLSVLDFSAYEIIPQLEQSLYAQ